MKWTTPKTVAIAALPAAVILFGVRLLGLTDAWVSALSALLTVAVSAFALLLPLQQEAEKKRATHLKILVDEVLTPLSDQLQGRYLATVSRSTFPLEWWPNLGLFVRSRGAQATILNPPPEPRRGLQKHRYEDVRSHYLDIIEETEAFQRDFEPFLDSLLEHARQLENDLRSQSNLRPIDGTEELCGCYYGALALYVFDRLWVVGYDHPLVVRRSPGTLDQIWVLEKTSDTANLARGTEQEMRQLNDLIEQLIASKDRTAFTRSAEQMAHRLDRLQDEIAGVQASEKLIGNCPTLK